MLQSTPTKRVVIFVKDATTNSTTGADSDRQVASCHVTPAATARSPDSDDSGRGRSSEDGAPAADNNNQHGDTTLTAARDRGNYNRRSGLRSTQPFIPTSR